MCACALVLLALVINVFVICVFAEGFYGSMTGDEVCARVCVCVCVCVHVTVRVPNVCVYACVQVYYVAIG